MFKKVRAFITNGSGKWVNFPLSDEEKNEIKDSFDDDYSSLRVSPSLTYFLDDDYKRCIEVNTSEMNLDQLDQLAEAIKYYTEKRRKNAHIKKMEKDGKLKIGQF
ncbi:hypothetical protein AV545_04195 [Paenibacillus jamilae]|uniref:hypothetical protein n=1 Tax=Paenibacillus jamilae TaxID=114136 RepID=UPI0007ABD003|nr:hypothetical protein [Paenibacillus jamilae]KZE65131.1 hypothetical protein AV545_04195 [Paenibacillus jamilae]